MKKKVNNNVIWTYIYKLYLSNGDTYVGLRHCNCLPADDTKYLGSSKNFNKKDIVKKEILIEGHFDDKTLSELETFYILESKKYDKCNLNITNGAAQFNVYNYTKITSKEVLEKFKLEARRRWDDPTTRKKLEEKRKTQNTDEVKEKIKQSVHRTCSDPDWKKQHSEKIKAALNNPETQKKIKTANDKKRGRPGNRAKKVLCIETGIIYRSAGEAGKSIGRSTVDYCCRGETDTCGGYHWKYVD